MKELLDEIKRWRSAGLEVAMATVVETRKSAPRPAGSKMAVSSDGQVAGTVSGGCVEGAVVEAALTILGGGDPKLLHFGIADADAWEVGLPCGGEIDIWVERWDSPRFEQVAEANGRAAMVTAISGPAAGMKLMVEPDRAVAGSLGSESADEEALRYADDLIWEERSEVRGDLFVDVLAPAPRLVIVGAVDVAAALCRLACDAGWEPWIIDPRSRFATRERFPDAEGIVVAWPEEGFAKIGGLDRSTSVVALTHDPKIDDLALAIALRSDARFVGAMGSRRATEARRARLLELGLDEPQLDRLAAPLGLDLGASSTGETALSMLSEVVAARNGRSGGRLAEATGRIHDLTA